MIRSAFMLVSVFATLCLPSLDCSVASAQGGQRPGSAEVVLNECEADQCNGTWVIRGRQGTATWTNNARGSLVITESTPTSIVFRRSDTDGNSPGLTAVYKGEIAGAKITGTVVWTWYGFGPPHGRAAGKWSATLASGSMEALTGSMEALTQSPAKEEPPTPASAATFPGATSARPPIGEAQDSETSPGIIHVHSATYGGNCGATANNDLSRLKAACDGRAVCAYTVNVNVIGDPVYGCAKQYDAGYSCGPDANARTPDAPARAAVACAEANGSTLTLDCRSPVNAGVSEPARQTEGPPSQLEMCTSKQIRAAMQKVENASMSDPNGAALGVLARVFMGIDAGSGSATILDSKMGTDGGRYTSKDPGSYVCRGLFVHGDVHVCSLPGADGAADLTADAMKQLMDTRPTFIEWFKVKPLENGHYKLTLLPSSLQLAREYSLEFTYP